MSQRIPTTTHVSRVSVSFRAMYAKTANCHARMRIYSPAVAVTHSSLFSCCQNSNLNERCLPAFFSFCKYIFTTSGARFLFCQKGAPVQSITLPANISLRHLYLKYCAEISECSAQPCFHLYLIGTKNLLLQSHVRQISVYLLNMAIREICKNG